MPIRDLNALLAEEQTAIMNAEAETDPALRDGHREVARQARELVDRTPFPAREPHDFGRSIDMAPPGSDRFADEFAALQRHVRSMEDDLAQRFSEGAIGMKHTMLPHHERVIGRARDRLGALDKRTADRRKP